MFARLSQLCSAALFAFAFAASLPASTFAANDDIRQGQEGLSDR
jgi:hypothetical protein